MKSIILSGLMGITSLFISHSVVAQPTLEQGAKIEFVKETHDYGNVKYGANGVCTFKFKNTGDAPLVIMKAKESCGCTVPSWPKEPIAPGQTSEITVKYDTKRPGVINKSVTITSNAVNEPSKILRIKGTVAPQANALVNSSGPTSN